jgi:hypothetical protein
MAFEVENFMPNSSAASLMVDCFESTFLIKAIRVDVLMLSYFLSESNKLHLISNNFSFAKIGCQLLGSR